MTYKCPYCDKDLTENDIMNGICPHCKKLLDSSSFHPQKEIDNSSQQPNISNEEEKETIPENSNFFYKFKGEIFLFLILILFSILGTYKYFHSPKYAFKQVQKSLQIRDKTLFDKYFNSAKVAENFANWAIKKLKKELEKEKPKTNGSIEYTVWEMSKSMLEGMIPHLKERLNDVVAAGLNEDFQKDTGILHEIFWGEIIDSYPLGRNEYILKTKEKKENETYKITFQKTRNKWEVIAIDFEPILYSTEKTITEVNLKQIGLALMMYIQDHKSSFPETLSDLYPEYISDKTIFILPEEFGKIKYTPEGKYLLKTGISKYGEYAVMTRKGEVIWKKK